MEALHDIVKSRKVRYFGASNMFARKFAKTQHIAKEKGWTQFVAMQKHYIPAYPEEDMGMIPPCRDQGVVLLSWSPLARSFLAGNRTRGDTGSGATANARMDEIAHRCSYHDTDFTVREALGTLARERASARSVVMQRLRTAGSSIRESRPQ